MVQSNDDAKKTETELYFLYKCHEGLKRKGLFEKKEYLERLNYEYETIRKMGYCGYFLVVADVLNWARKNQIIVGMGRGSAAGSMVAYLLGITALDPIKYGLYFERFLNPGRIGSPPDIDCDIQDDKRDLVIDYIKEKYGKDCVCNIGTFGSMKAKAAIRDVCRTLGYDYDTGDKLAGLILQPIEGKVQDLETCYEKVPALVVYKEQVGTIESQILNWAEKLENRIRSFGCHASGLVISPDPVWNHLPIYPGKEKQPVSQFEMYTVEEVGLVKFDFLGLKALTTVGRCLDLIKKRTNEEIDILGIPIDDEKVYREIFCAGDLFGIFQFEGSQGISDLTIQIQPLDLEDLAIINSLFRPGPLTSNMTAKFIEIRNYLAEPEYLVPELKPILSKTSSVLIYQEQVLEICKQLAGYTLAEADKMRKILGKKLPEEMKKQKEKFIAGMVGNKFREEDAIRLFDEIEVFAGYSFNKCIAGTTEVFRGTCGKNGAMKGVSIEHLYKTRNDLSYAIENNVRPLRKKLRRLGYGEILAYDKDGRVRPRKIKDIYFNGPKEVYRITLQNGKSVDATIDHKFLTLNGYKKVQDLSIGQDSLITDEGYEKTVYKKKEECQDPNWKSKPYSRAQIGFQTGKDNPAYTDGEWTKFIAIVESRKHIVFCQKCGKEVCIKKHALEYHHIDGNHNNNTEENVIKVCNSCHKKMDYQIGKRKKRWTKGRKSGSSTIISIEKIGTVDTYDIEMDTEEHNFIANGIVSSNSHAISYSYLSYIMAWLKTYYPVEFLCSCLTTDSNEVEKVIKYIDACRKRNIQVLPPDINKSEDGFSIDDNAVRFGFSAIKNIGTGPVKLIRQERKVRPFRDLLDFLGREKLLNMNRRQVESLILAGAFDSLDQYPNRKYMTETVDAVWAYRGELKKYNSKMETYEKRSVSFLAREKEIEEGATKKPFKKPEPPEKPTIPMPKMGQDFLQREKLAKEKELLGYYISGHPLDDVPELDRSGILTIAQIKDLDRGRKVSFIAIISLVKEITTKKKKQKMAFLTLEDKTGSIEAVIAPSYYEEYAYLIDDPTMPVGYKGIADIIENDEAKVVRLRIQEMIMLPSQKQRLAERKIRSIRLEVAPKDAIEVANTIRSNPGNTYEVDFWVKTDNVLFGFGKYRCSKLVEFKK